LAVKTLLQQGLRLRDRHRDESVSAHGLAVGHRTVGSSDWTACSPLNSTGTIHPADAKTMQAHSAANPLPTLIHGLRECGLCTAHCLRRLLSTD
jgi:hypothetical protein